MQKFLIQFAALLIIILVATIFIFNPGANLPLSGFLSKPSYIHKLKIGNTLINVEVADTQAKRTKGLGDRPSLASDSGMLFVFDTSAKHSFWMKGMKFPLDFIWIRDDTVVDLLQNIPPPEANQADSSLPVYGPITEVNKVLEVNKGFISNWGIKISDRVQFVQ